MIFYPYGILHPKLLLITSIKRGLLCSHLLIEPHCVQPLIHDVHPSVLGGEDEERHECLAQVVKVVLVVDPAVAVAAQLQALSLVGDAVGVGALAVVEDALEQLEEQI